MNEVDRKIIEAKEKLKLLEFESKQLNEKSELEQSLSQIIWEQFILQICGGAANEFFKDNHNLNLSLKKADHYLSDESFFKNEMPSHNFLNKAKYQERYDTYRSHFTDDSMSTFNDSYRDAFDANRPRGNDEFHMDHITPVSQILKDRKAAVHLSLKEKVSFANDTDINLKPLDAEYNIFKGGRTHSEAMYERDGNGVRAVDKYNLNENKLLNDEKISKKEWENTKDEGVNRTLKEGQQSIKSEIVRSASVTLDAIAIALLAKMLKDIFSQVIVRTRNKNRNIKELITYIKDGFTNFIKDTKNNLILSADVGLTTFLAQIFGEIVITIRKILLGFKIGWKTCKEIYTYTKDPLNKEKDDFVRLIEIEKIAVKGVVAVGGIALSEVISNIIKISYPPAAAPLIPILGSPANLLGIFFGTLTSGVIGVLALNHLEKKLLRVKVSDNINERIKVSNEIISLQNEQYNNKMGELVSAQRDILTSMANDFKKANDEINSTKFSVKKENTKNSKTISEIEEKLHRL